MRIAGRADDGARRCLGPGAGPTATVGERTAQEAPISTSHAGRRVGRPAAVTMPCTVTAVAATSSSAREQVGHLERRAGRRGQGEVHVDLVVEAQRLAVADVGLEDGRVEPGRAPRGVRVAEVPEVGHPGLLEVREVAAVVDDAHGVGLGEAHPQTSG